MPIVLFSVCFLCELVYQPLGDGCYDSDAFDAVCVDTVVSTPANYVQPGYAGAGRRLSDVSHMAPDGLCLYHSISAAPNYEQFRIMIIMLHQKRPAGGRWALVTKPWALDVSSLQSQCQRWCLLQWVTAPIMRSAVAIIIDQG